MIGWNDWGGHWQVIIGYDTMGTEVEQDDVLIVADPYDTTDHPTRTATASIPPSGSSTTSPSTISLTTRTET
jgi:hypothetical protein